MIVAGGWFIALGFVYWVIVELLVLNNYSVTASLLAQAPISVSVASMFLSGIILISAAKIIAQINVNAMLLRTLLIGFDRPNSLEAGALVNVSTRQDRGIVIALGFEDGVMGADGSPIPTARVFFEDGVCLSFRRDVLNIVPSSREHSSPSSGKAG